MPESKKISQLTDDEFHNEKLKTYYGVKSNGLTSAELSALELVDPPWLVEKLLPQGLILLAGKPKAGKSFLSLQIAGAVSVGIPLFGTYKTRRCKVLYLALEDGRRLTQKRWKFIEEGYDSPDLRFYFDDDWPSGEPGLKAIDTKVEEYPETKLVVLDMLLDLFPDSDITDYTGIRASLKSLRAIAIKREISILATFHCRKYDGGDFDDIIGSQAFGGAPDCRMIIRKRQSSGYLKIDGREIDEQELAVKLIKDQGWKFLGEGEEHRKSELREAIVRTLADATEPISPKDVSSMIEEHGYIAEYGTVKTAMYRMEADGQIVKASRGLYKNIN